jgi:hypothetical protein
MNIKPLFLAFALFGLTHVQVAQADDPLATLQQIATKDLLAIAYVDIESIDAGACLIWASQQGLFPAEDAAEFEGVSAMAQGFIQQASKAGVEHVFAVVQQQDLTFQGPPLFVFSIEDGKEASKTVKSLRRIMGFLQIPNFELDVFNNSIVGGTAEQIAAAKKAQAVERSRLVTAWKKFGGHDAGAFILGSDDTRRSVRELLPTLDAPFQMVNGNLVADKIDSVGFFLQLPGDIDAKFVFQTTDPQAAQNVKTAVLAAKEILVSEGSEYAAMVPAIGVAALKNLNPQIEGTEVVLDLQPLLTDKLLLANLLEPMRVGSRQTQRQNNLRQAILAMLNYEAANRSLPAYANFDDAGKPLLSWRVHILPFLDQMELYRQFKLDEPWNSPHNISLVKKMPDVFSDPSRELNEMNAAGRTRMVVPKSKVAIFHGQEGTTFKQITDGSSNTIAIVNVCPERAVIWTQPVDWDVDLENPKDGLFDDRNKVADFSRADGSTGVFELDVPASRVKAMLTKEGGEIVP